MNDSASAMVAKNGAIKKIRDNIEKIYDDFIVNKEIHPLRIVCDVKPELYEKNKEAVAGIKDIEDLINFLDDRRLEQLGEDDKNKIEDENITKLNALIAGREKEWADKKGIPWPTQEEFKMQGDDYVKNEVKRIMQGSTAIFLFKRININPDLWRSVIASMFLRVPIEKTLECDESILTKYFLPTIDNDSLIIRINELTKPGDFELISDLIEAKQNDCSAKHGYVNSTSTIGYPSRKTDRLITDCYRRGLNLNEINAELKNKDITKEYKLTEIKERIEEYLRQTRQPAEKIKIAGE